MAHYRGPASESQRAMHLQKRRERHQEEMEIKKKKLTDELKFDKMESKFSAHYDAVEEGMKSSTVGLLHLSEMKSVQESAVRKREMELAKKDRDERKSIKEEKKSKKKKQKDQIKALSFNPDDDEEEEEEEDGGKDSPKPGPSKETEEKDNKEVEEESGDSKLKKKRLGMNPDVNTSFLPDIDRDEEENQLREELRQNWVEAQKKLKEESIDIVFSYWDGSGHRRSLTMKKGHTIYNFLQKALETLRPDFSDLRIVTADQLMYVKEDLIIPQSNTFYDFIVTKARGKSGPLFKFDAQDDVRLVSDATVEKDESHAGKVVMRSWYERNKHIFPASRWEPFDPTKSYDKYTVHDRKKQQ